MTTAAPVQETAPETVGMGIRLTSEQREELDRIARRQCNTVGGIIRLAVQNFVEQERESVSSLHLTQTARSKAA